MSPEHHQWMNDIDARKIPAEKLDFLQKLFEEGHGKSRKELMATIVPLLKDAREKGLSFQPEEINAAVSAMRKYSSPRENAGLDKILSQNKESEG